MEVQILNIKTLMVAKVLFMFFASSNCSSFSSLDVKNLLHNITIGYDPTLRPILNQSKAIVINTEFMISSMSEINDVEQTIKLETYFKFTWTDEHLTWDPSTYNGVDTIYPYSSSIWMPSVNLVRSKANHPVTLTDMETSYPIKVRSSGEVRWILPATLFTSCAMDMSKFPNDEQTCFFFIAFNGYTWNDAQFLTNPEMKNPIPANVSECQWTFKKYWMDTAKYVLLGENNSGIVISVTLKRLPDFFTINLLFPTTSLSFLNVIVFLLPVESGEKVSYSITVLLSVMLYQSSASSYLPVNCVNTPNVIIFLTALTSISILSVIANLVTVFVHHWKNSVKQEGPFSKNSGNFNDERGLHKNSQHQVFIPQVGAATHFFIQHLNTTFFVIFLTVWTAITLRYVMTIFI